jgi:hypothetical protein
MRLPDAQRIIRLRHIALIVLRSVSIVLLIVSATQFGHAIGWAIAMWDFSSLFVMWSDNWSPFAMGVAFAGPAVILLVLDRRIVRWMIPVPRMECPECGYAFEGLASPQCPECGLRLGSEQEMQS